MALLDVIQSDPVARRLTAPSERWGWEFHQPIAAQPFPHPEPLWREPATGSFAAHAPAYLKAKAKAPQHAVIAASMLLVGLCLRKWGILLDLGAIGLACLWFIPLITGRLSADQKNSAIAEMRQRAWNAHCAGVDRWRVDMARWREQETRRVNTSALWFPIQPKSLPSRIDVFGGVPEGWSNFLITLGSGLLGQRARLSVLDLSEADVAGRLVKLARQIALPCAHISLPAGLENAGLLDGLDGGEAAELIAEALHARRSADDSGLRDLDADILRSVATRLDGPLTFAKLVSALLFVQRSDSGTGGGPPLTTSERQRLADYVDVLGTSERNLAQVQDLRSTLESLTGGQWSPTDESTPAVDDRAGEGLTVFVSEDPNSRRRDLLDRLVVRTLIHRLRRDGNAGDVLAVAGADHLGIATLEELARSARRAGVRLVLLIEHLREEFEPYLGGSDSVSVFMRMGNAKEAGRAAEHVGRGHSFQLTQLSRTEGTSSAYGTSTSSGTNHSVSESSGRGAGGSNSSTSVSDGTSDQYGSSRTTTDNQSDAMTESRVYEFTVEPTRFQDLDASGYLLVEPLPGGGRRVLAGTCNPAVLTLPRVADHPLPDEWRHAPQRSATPGETPQQAAMKEVTVSDPSGALRLFADRLTGAGYLVHYQADQALPFLSGWRVTGHRDGRPLNEREILSYK